ncbi:MAG: leucyl aminopeptidase [Chitinivibrionia bacterium]|nr:leucyl aminopeptidase [Chitinivibrionia bacterium]
MEILNTKNIEARILFLYEDDEKPVDFEAKAGSVATRYDGENVIIYAGLGKDNSDMQVFRNAVADAVRAVNKIKRKSVEIVLPQKNTEYAAAAVEGAVVGNYAYDKYLSEKKSRVENLHIDFDGAADILNSVKIIGECADFTRDITNDNAAVVNPEYLANEAKKIAESNKNMTVEILDHKEIQEKGLGLLWAVGKGSATPPRLAIIKYNGDKTNDKYSAIVGKGLTFDTGGLNLKPSGSMETMRHDMAGAAAVLGVAKAVAALNPKINFLAVVPTAQSAIGKDAFFVGDVYKGYSGKTVEVLNTDAEGRLILSDAISYIIKNYAPTEIVDIATLTGAIVIALGDTVAGMFSNNDDLAKRIFEAGEKTGEPVWRMPIRQEHREAVKSDIADIQNTSTMKRSASSTTAATFIESFVEDLPWCHLDIAGTSWNENAAKGMSPKFATGVCVRLLWEYLNNR